ncbi:hypothetical protein GGI20_003545 [Coemansia sp. BCRC 34301]|nr:hypothetical protein GGI20_003545 [Coemansia sp. BCRC 34301]
MEDASRLSRKAAELELKQSWAEAAEVHRQAASSYNDVGSFDFDPVATLTLASLVNKHVRWAEHCEQKSEQITSSAQNQPIVAQQDPHGSAMVSAEAPSKHNNPDTLKRAQNSDNEHEFEDFWQYMQRWLADPTAFTRPTLPSSSRDVGASAGLESQGPGPSIMESFYLVGSNPDQSASIYGATAAIPRVVAPKTESAPLHALSEVNEPDDDSISKDTVLAAASPGVPASGTGADLNKDVLLAQLTAENNDLRRQLRRQSERIRALESAARENNMLKSSILSFREEFHRHANVVTLPRILEHSSSPRRVQTPPTDAVDESQVRQLELQLQQLQLENTKQVSLYSYIAIRSV